MSSAEIGAEDTVVTRGVGRTEVAGGPELQRVWLTSGVTVGELLVRRLHVDLLRVATAACR